MLYIILSLVSISMVAFMAAPVFEPSWSASVAIPDEESNQEESGAEKVKYEYGEETSPIQPELPDSSALSQQFYVLSDNRLLDHTIPPVSPPPDSLAA